MTLTVYHMQRSQSERVVYLCEELGLDYNLEVYPRNEVGLAPPIFKELHPVGTAPVVIDTTPSGQKIVMAESGSILEYIDKVHGQGRLSVSPTDDPARYAQYLEWLHFGSATLQANYSRMMMFTRMQMLDSGPAKFVKAKIDTCMNIYEKHFATSKYLMGDEISVADCYTVFTMTTMRGMLFELWILSIF